MDRSKDFNEQEIGSSNYIKGLNGEGRLGTQHHPPRMAKEAVFFLDGNRYTGRDLDQEMGTGYFSERTPAPLTARTPRRGFSHEDAHEEPRQTEVLLTAAAAQHPTGLSANSDQAGYGYKDRCLKLADVRRNDTVGPIAAVPCRRSHNCMRVVVDRGNGHQHS